MEQKSMTVRIDVDKWKKAKTKMLDDGKSFQKLFEEKVEEYIKGEE